MTTRPEHAITVYLLHFAEPIEHAQHYLGSCETDRLAERMREHAKAKGAKLTAEACRRGISWTVAATWHTPDRALEKHMKKVRHYKRRCPICRNPASGLGLFTVTPEPIRPKSDETVTVSWPSSKRGDLP